MRPRRVLVPVVQVAATVLAVAAASVLVVPRLLGWQGTVVLSGSMEPALPVGAVAFVDETRPDDIDAGDILTFSRAGDGRRITHRVVEVVQTPSGPRYRTRGDANDAPDAALVTPAQVVGTVQVIVPRLGRFAQAVTGNRVLLGLVMGLAAAVLIAGDVRRRQPVRAPGREPTEPTAPA